MKAAIALVDDHALLRNGLASLVRDLNYNVVFEAGNGQQFIEKLKTNPLPQVVLMDINMPLMNGFDTTSWLKKNHPSVRVIALTMLDDDASIIRMLKNGAKGYLLKDSEPEELKAAIEAVLLKGFYHSELVSGKLMHAINNPDGNDASGTTETLRLTEKEREFLNWTCTELSYKEIADHMRLSVRTVEGYRDNLQEKLSCKGRVGLVLWAIKNEVVAV